MVTSFVEHAKTPLSPREADGEKVFIGTQGWSVPGWEGLLYPRGLKQADRLGVYAQTFNSVEVNTSFYGVPSLTTVANWYAVTPPAFRFALKMPREITHSYRLRDPEPILRTFLRAAAGLKEKLGPILIQLPPTFNVSRLTALSDFLRRLPVDDMQFCVEVRRATLRSKGVRNLLHRRRIGLVSTNLVSEPGEVEVANDLVYLRLLGSRAASESVAERTFEVFTAEAARWAASIRLATAQTSPEHAATRRAFVFVSNDYFGPGILPAAYLMKQFGKSVRLRGLDTFLQGPIQGALL